MAQTQDNHLFAPGACRHNASKRPISGENTTTSGWSLEEYRTKVRGTQGGAPIVETTEEREIVPLLRAALSLENFYASNPLALSSPITDSVPF